MKCKVFAGFSNDDVVAGYNDWAKDKMLTKDVIVHTHFTYCQEHKCVQFIIVVFFDETIHPSW